MPACAIGVRLPMFHVLPVEYQDMLLESLCALALTVYAIVLIEGWLARRLDKGRADEAAALRSAQAALDAAAASTPRLRIAGTRTLPREEHRRLARFGLRPECACELRVYDASTDLSAWPTSVVRALRLLHEAGRARGPGVVDLLFGRRALPVGHGLYFALVDGAGDEDPQPLAFVDALS
jgi:hypothetical protein